MAKLFALDELVLHVLGSVGPPTATDFDTKPVA